MFFTKLGRFVAFGGLAIAVCHFVYLQVYIYNFQAATGESFVPGARVFESVSNALKETGTVFLVSVVLGVFTEISRSLSTNVKE